MTRHPLTDKIATSIKAGSLIGPADRVLVALSGGADSVALLFTLRELGYDCMAVHCNFHLRGDESDRDEAHAVAVAESAGVSIKVAHFDTESERRATGESIEMACRRLRYDLFERLRAETGASVIAVAHHRDDNVETFFLNLLRGAGIGGLKGMTPATGRIVRPMLSVTRTEIEDYLGHIGAGYVTDSTNLANDFARNRLRNLVIPQLNELFPDASDSVSRSIANLQSAWRFYRRAIGELHERYVDADGVIDLRRLTADNPEADVILGEWLRAEGFDPATAVEIMHSADRSGRIFINRTGEKAYLLDRGRLLPDKSVNISDNASDAERIVDLTQPPFTMTESDVADFSPTRLADSAWFDADILSGNPQFALRRWHDGDRMAPLGMKGSKKLSDIFNDAHIPLNEKKNYPVLTRNGEIIWVVGLRQSRRFAVGQSTRRFIRLRFGR